MWVWLLSGILFPFSPYLFADDLPTVGIGYELRFPPAEDSRFQPLQAEAISTENPLYLRVILSWEKFPAADSREYWKDLDLLIRRHARSGYRVILSLEAADRVFLADPQGATADSPPELEPWLEFVREAARRYRKQADYFGILDGDRERTGAKMDPARFAFVLKNSAVAIKSENPGARILIGGRGDVFLKKIPGIYREEIAPYVDVWILRPVEGQSIAGLLETAEDTALQVDPSARIWLGGVSPGREGDRIARAFLEGAGRGAGVTFFRLPPDGEGGLLHADRLVLLHEQFRPGFSRVEDPGDAVAFRTEEGSEVGVRWFRFFDSERFFVLVGYFAADPGVAPDSVEAVLDTWDVTDLAIHDLIQGGQSFPDLYLPDRRANTTTVTLPLGPATRILSYKRFATPDLLRQEESLEVTGRRQPPVEEIIARHQEVQSGQDARLRNYIADGELTFHYSLGNSSSLVDLTYRSQFLFDRAVGAQWVQKELLWNGVSYKGKKIPKLPYVEPERVVSLPLEIILTRDYGYKLLGSEKVRGRDAWAISFTPQRQDASLYKGKVWIDKETFVKLRISSVQTGLEPPTISNDQRDQYRPVVTGDGDFWLLQAIDGQQLLTVSGRNLVVNREIEFTNFRINVDDFEQIRQEAYASNDPILQDTPNGFRFLEKQKDGTRVLKEDIEDRTLFGLAGVFYNESVDNPIPLVGFNYFDFHVGDSDVQLELFTAGAFNFFNLTDPQLFGSPLEGGVDVTLRAFKLADRYFVGENEIDAARVDEISQFLSLNLGLPFADFFKLRGFFEFAYTNYSADDDTDPGFVLPQDTFVTSFELRGEFHRSGWSVEGFGRTSNRNDWQPWGSPNPVLEGTRLTDYDPEQKDFLTYGGSISKQFFLPFFQIIRLEGNWRQGDDLDRFSKFRFSSFGDNRLRGYGGSGIRFDQGGIGRLQYSFNLAELLRFDAFVDHAYVRDRTLLSTGGDYQNFTGVGLSTNFVLRGGLIVNLDYGIAVQSDIAGLENEQEVQLIFLKIF